MPVWTFDIGGEMGWNGLVRQGDNWVPAVVIESFKLILLPVYLAHYRLPGDGHYRLPGDGHYRLPDDAETYDVLINGQNGVVRAERTEGVIGRLWEWLAG
jgi:hypothetical protein